MATTTVSLVTTGGTAPYHYSVINDGLTTIPVGAITLDDNLSTLTIDGTSINPGNYSVNLSITDALSKSTTKVISVKIIDKSKFAILNESTSVIPNSFPYNGSIKLLTSGETGSVAWSLLSSATTLPGATIGVDNLNNPVLTYISSQYGSFTVGLQAKDSFRTITKIITVSTLAPSAYKLVNGLIEADFKDNGFTEGIHSFTVTLGDSSTIPATTTRSYEFLLQPAISTINIPQSSVKYWFLGDSTSVYFPITGTLSGLSIQDSSGNFANGVSYSVEGTARRIKFSGPPTVAENSELTIPINLQFGNSVVASVAKTFTIPAFDGAADQSSITSACYTRPIIVGEQFSLNPQKPYWNSPSIERMPWIARVKSGEVLPSGLSLDENTGLIYGRVLSDSVKTSIIEFVDSLTHVKGSIYINFDIVAYDFSLIESLDTAALSFSYNGIISTTSTSDLASAEVYYGTLPNGLSLGVSRTLTTGLMNFDATLGTISRTAGSWIDDGVKVGSVIALSGFATTANNKTFTVSAVTDATITVKETVTLASETGTVTANTKAVISGVPTEAGHFDIWIKVTNVDGKSGYLYKRFEVTYSTPLSVVTTSIPALTNQPYNAVLSAIGGSGVYSWSLDPTSPALPDGITLSTSGLLSGTYVGSSYSQNLVFRVTDTKGAIALATIALSFNNTLTIVTSSIPNIVRGETYSFTLQAYGGSGSYTNWAVSGGALPNGITIDAASGVLSGYFVGTTYTPIALTFTVTDSSSSTYSKSLTVAVADAPSTLTIDSSGVGVINKGCNYQGVMKAVVGTSTAVGPFYWEVAPGSPNQLPTGLSLSVDAGSSPSTNGLTAYITGRCTQALTNYSVKIRVIDTNGQVATTFLLFNSIPSVKITSTSLAQGRVGQAYSQTLTGVSCNLPIVFSLDSGSPALPAGFSLNSAGFLTGTPSSVYNQNIIIKLTDSLGDSTTLSFPLVIKNSLLLLTTTSIPNISSGKSWSYTLTASGGTGVYSWSVAPSSASQLPTNVQLSSTTGTLTTTGTSSIGTRVITFRVTDSEGTVTDKDLTVTVVASQTVTSGPDYINGTSNGYLGYVSQDYDAMTSQILPRNNKSFYAFLTNFSATSLSQITVSTSNPAITAVPEFMTATEVGINITGVPAGTLGDNFFTLNIMDGSTPVSATLKYKVVESRYIQGKLGNGNTLPVQSVSTTSTTA